MIKVDYWQCFELLSFIFSIIYYKGLRAYGLQLMPWFLFYIVCNETIAAYYTELGLPSTRPFANIYYFVSPVIFYIFFYNMLRPEGKYVRLYKIMAIASVCFFIFDLLNSSIFELNTITVIVSLTQHAMLSLILLFRLSFDEKRRVRLIKEPYFWMGVGILIFSLVTIVTMGLQPYIYRNRILIAGKSAYMTIMPMVCVILYSCYCYAFYLTSRTKSKYQLA